MDFLDLNGQPQSPTLFHDLMLKSLRKQTSSSGSSSPRGEAGEGGAAGGPPSS